MQQVHALPSRPVSRRTARAMSAPPLSRRKWVDIAIAAVLIVGMLGGSFWYADVRIGGGRPTGPDATRYAAQPLSAVSTPVVAEAVPANGDPGHAANYPAGFDPAAEHDAMVLEDGPSSPQHAAISGDILVVSGGYPEGIELEGRGLTAIDLTTGQMLWATETVPLREFILVDGMIYGAFELEPEPDSMEAPEFRMMALDMDTGKPAWTGEPLMEQNAGLDVVSPAVSFNVFRPTVIDGMLYYVDRNGQVIALDAATGEQQWSVALEHETTEPGWGRGGSVVGDEEAVYAVDGQNVIRKLDLVTGEELDRFPMRDRPSSAYVMGLHLKGDTLVTISYSLDYEGTTGFVDAVSIEDGEILWSQRLGTVFPFVTVTDGVVAIPHRVSETEVGAVSGDITEPGTYVSFFDLGTGDPISLYGPSSAEGATVSSSGDVVCINEGTLISCVDTASDDRTLVSLPYAPGEGSFAPLLFWNETAIVLDMDDGVTLLRPVESPQSAVISPEDEARGGGLGTTDRSLNNPSLEPIDGPLSLAWSQTISDPMWVLPYRDVVATLGSSEIAVHDAATGEVLWSKSTDEAFRNTTYDTERSPKALLGTRQGSPVALPWIVDDTMYYAGTTDLIGVDLHTGEEVFRTVHTVPDENTDMRMFFFPQDMVVRDDTAYVLTMPSLGHYVMTAIDLESGGSLWSYEAGEPSEDWAAVTTTMYQPAVTDELVLIQVLGEENTILALDRTDGSLVWEEPNALRASRESGNFGSNISVIDGRYLVLADRNTSTGTIDGTPNADESTRIALYDLTDGEVLWTVGPDAGGWPSDIEPSSCGLAMGWKDDNLYLGCMAGDDHVTIGLDIESGQVTYSGIVGTEAPAYLMFQDGHQNLYYGTENTLMRLDPTGQGMEEIRLEGGEACVPNAASNEVVVCHTDDGIGTYGIQVYTRGSAATPQASPVASP
jgi:outer membrane protein assembly factor BamB